MKIWLFEQGSAALTFIKKTYLWNPGECQRVKSSCLSIYHHSGVCQSQGRLLCSVMNHINVREHRAPREKDLDTWELIVAPNKPLYR